MKLKIDQPEIFKNLHRKLESSKQNSTNMIRIQFTNLTKFFYSSFNNKSDQKLWNNYLNIQAKKLLKNYSSLLPMFKCSISKKGNSNNAE